MEKEKKCNDEINELLSDFRYSFYGHPCVKFYEMDHKDIGHLIDLQERLEELFETIADIRKEHK